MISWIRTHQQTIIKMLGSLLAFGSLFFLFKQQNLGDALVAVQKITWNHFGMALGFLVLSRLFTVARWHVLLRSADLDISFWKTTKLTFIGLFASNFLPTTIGGDIARIGGAIQFGYSRIVSTASVVVDRLIGMLGMAMVLPFGVASLSDWALEISAAGGNAFFISKGLQRFLDVFKRLGKALKIWSNQPLALFIALLFSWGHMLSIFASVFVIISGLGETISFWNLAGLWSLTYFVTLLPVSVNGYGMQELSLTYFLSNIGGLALPNSLVVAVLIRVVTVLASVPGSIFFPSIFSKTNKAKNL